MASPKGLFSLWLILLEVEEADQVYQVDVCLGSKFAL